MAELVLTTYDWVPEMPRGFVRDLRVRWALEEAGLPYRMASTPFRTRGPEHLAHQTFAQVPWLTDEDLTIFESGAILLHLGQRNEALMPADPRGRADVTNWVFAALNSVEMASMPWFMLSSSTEGKNAVDWKQWDDFFKSRLACMEAVLADREWLTDRFSIADILMADVLRLPDRKDGLANHPACRAYVARATARPAFIEAHADQLAHFVAGDRAARGRGWRR
jgi:glutathione S-transferase